jgi:GNAT superfamily N-acetyltransferase
LTADFRIDPLRRDHAVERFDCGRPELNHFLVRFALQAQQANASRTYVALSGEVVVGYHSLVASEVVHAQAPERVTKGMARHPVPLMLLARLAVHQDFQGQGLGAGLLRDAMQRTLQAADILGIRALAVHAKDEAAAAFYTHFGFVPSPVSERHMFLLLKDIQRMRGG